jgi:hypothetical protein
MPFPTLAPTSRNYDPGDWPSKAFSSLSGAEIRIRYGNRRVNAKLNLSYDNISDGQAEQFLTHYYETNGTFFTFSLPPAASTGWRGTATAFSPGSPGAAFRYASAPQITSVRPGRSSVQVELIGVS